MELKTYQRQVITDLSRYLELLVKTKDYIKAFNIFWQEKNAPTLGVYQDVLPGVPNLCFKVPTGGGKTFLACNAIRPVFDALPFTKTKAVVWLVPSDAILSQTIKALKDPHNPYRQKIDIDFSGRVEVYTKQELLNGQNFNPTSVTEQLSIMVLSYDSFRGRSKEVLKAYQENSNLAAFSKILGSPECPIEKADETALFQVINQLNPLVIVDESHHAKTELSIEMLFNFNPCFVLDLTATPQKQSNIISYVDAVQLKTEHMVKLPVIVYNRDKQSEVLVDTIDLRNKLEEIATAELHNGGKYIRPIALFQAEPKGKENAATFEKLRTELIESGIPSEYIAIRTAEINELSNIDLLSSECPIRYIITINALKEGWDCSFAYILASLANKSSQIDVEQILGRILRLSYTTEHKKKALNMSYVLTSSNDFNNTIQQIIRGLNNAGFSDKDYRLAEPLKPSMSFSDTKPKQLNIITPPQESEASEDDFLNFDGKLIKTELLSRKENEESVSKTDSMIKEAQKASDAYDQTINGKDYDPFIFSLPLEVRSKVNTFHILPQYKDSLENLRIPQFFHVIPETLFTEETKVLLDKEQLAEGFTLKGKAYDIDFSTADDEIVKVDIENDHGVPKAYKMNSADQLYFKEYFNNLPPESKVRQCKDMMVRQLDKLNLVDRVELRTYINLIVAGMNREQLSAMEKAPLGFAAKIRLKIENLLSKHFKETFFTWLDRGRIICEPYYVLPSAIHPTNSTALFGKSLYEAEDSMNTLEQDLVKELTSIPNVLWWHRNIARHGFAINGYLNHYPDIMLMTQNGKIILVETKGDHLKNDDSLEKIELGTAWRNAAGNHYRYYMVFRENENLPHGALSIKQFIDTVKAL